MKSKSKEDPRPRTSNSIQCILTQVVSSKACVIKDIDRNRSDKAFLTDFTIVNFLQLFTMKLFPRIFTIQIGVS